MAVDYLAMKEAVYSFGPSYHDDALSVGGSEKLAVQIDRFAASSALPLGDDFFEHFTLKIQQIGPESDFLANGMGWVLGSRRVAHVLEQPKFRKQVQLLRFPFPTGPVYKARGDYFLVNILTKLDCLDAVNSDVVWETNDVGARYISHIHNLHIRANEIPDNVLVFRLAPYMGIICVRARVIEELRTVGVHTFGAEPIGLSG